MRRTAADDSRKRRSESLRGEQVPVYHTLGCTQSNELAAGVVAHQLKHLRVFPQQSPRVFSHQVDHGRHERPVKPAAVVMLVLPQRVPPY